MESSKTSANKMNKQEFEEKPNELDDRLYCFSKTFLFTIEETLTTHYKILFDGLKVEGDLQKALVKIFGAPAKHFKIPVVKKCIELAFEEYNKNESYNYFDIIYKFHTDKRSERDLFLNIAIEVFQSFELQFNVLCLNISRPAYQLAMRDLGKDAAERFLNYIRDVDNISSENYNQGMKLDPRYVVYGSSKFEFFDKLKPKLGKKKPNIESIPFISYPRKNRPEFEILHGNDIWTTSNLYEKAGIVDTINGELKYFARKQSKCEKYLFRRPFDGENWNEEYCIPIKSSDVSVNFNEIHDHEYYDRQYDIILRRINEEYHENVEKLKENRKLIPKIISTVNEKIEFRLPKLVLSYTGREKELKNIHEVLSTTEKRVVCITGLGGIGKTQLAIKYANNHRKNYRNIIFINSFESLENSFKCLASQMGISIFENSCTIRDIVETVYSRLSGNSLIIFDNVEDYREIEEAAFSGNISTLITSRNNNLTNELENHTELIKLDKFAVEEATEYVKKVLGFENEEHLSILIEKLDGLPLALTSVLNYIKKQKRIYIDRDWEEFTVKSYLDLYEKEVVSLVDNVSNDGDNESIATTWKITLKKIKQDKQHGELALKIFHIMAYLSPDNIHFEDVFSDLETDHKNLWNAVELLINYSMVQLNRGIVSLHRLVQKVTRSYLNSKKMEESVLRTALELLNGSDFDEHILSAWECAVQYSKLIEDLSTVSDYGQDGKSVLHLFAMYKNDCNAIMKIYPRCSNKKTKFDETVLDVAIKKGNLDIANFLVSKKKNAHSNLRYAYMLNEAVEYGQDKMVKFILDMEPSGIDAVTDDQKRHWVEIATVNGNEEIVKIFMPINNKTHLLCARLVSAMIRRNYEIYEDVMKDLNESCPEFVQYKFGYSKDTILHIAAEKGDVKIIELLSKCGFDLDIRNDSDETPIHYAAKAGNVDVVNLLLEKGADFRAYAKNGRNLLYYAAFACDEETLKTLTGKGLKWDSNEIETSLLHNAANGNNISAIKFFIDQGHDIECLNDNSLTPLNCISMDSHCKDALKLLIELKADVNTADHYGSTPLCNSSTFNIYENTKILIKAGADLNQCDADDEFTPLHHAARNNNLKVANLLLKNNCNPNLIDIDDNNPLHLAIANGGNLPIIELLVKYKCDLKAVNTNGDTALGIAIGKNNTPIIKFLQEAMGINSNKAEVAPEKSTKKTT